jgi:hypothetical protein
VLVIRVFFTASSSGSPDYLAFQRAIERDKMIEDVDNLLIDCPIFLARPF